MFVLGIESTCDETAASIVENGYHIHSQIVSSQVDLHNIYGGVVPELACRRHMEVIIPVIDEALKKSHIKIDEVDLFACAYGPGLIGPLFIGVQTAKGLALAMNKPIIGVNHVEAHLYAAMMSTQEKVTFPSLGVILSGGHTALILVKAIGEYKLLGQTVDDAVGEAFDKVAKLLSLPYPGGPYIEALAQEGNPDRFPLKAGLCKNNPYNFSFSGLKTAVMYTLQSEDKDNPFFRFDLCASFQKTAFKDILLKAKKAVEETKVTNILFGGGVTNNQYLKRLFEEHFPKTALHWPSKSLSLDNASMIAGLGYHLYKIRGPSDLKTLEPQTRISFT